MSVVDGDAGDERFARAKRPVLVAAAVMVVGLALAASAEPTVGGVALLVAWAVALRALHQLGRAGSSR